MALNKKQRRFVSLNYRSMSVEEMSKELKCKNFEVEELVKNYKKVEIPGSSFDFWLRIKENLWFLGLICVFVTVVYANGMGADFVSDDYASITQNTNITNLGHMIKSLNFNDFFHFFIANIFGTTSPVPYHLLSLGIYLLSIVLVFSVCIVLTNRKVSYFSTIIFALLPIHVEAVTWISGKPYLWNALGVLWCFLLLLLYEKNQCKKVLTTLFISLPFAFLMEKVRFAALPIIFFTYVLTIGHWWRERFSLTKILAFSTIICLLMVVVLWPFVKDRVGSVNGGYNSTESIFYDPLEQYPTSITKYLQLTFFPVDLTLYHTMYVIPVWLNWLVILLYFALCVYFFFKNKYICFGLVFMFAASLPSMAPVKVSWVVAERYVFLGTFGIALVLGIILSRINTLNKYVSFILVFIIVGLCSWRIFERNKDWQTNHNLWVRTVQMSPNSHNAWNNIGDDYDKLKQYENAVKSFTQSTNVKPNYADAYHNRANIFFKMGRYDMARESYLTALKYSPGMYQSYMSLTQLSLITRNLKEANAFSEAYLKLLPQNEQAWFVRAVVLAESGEYDNAEVFINRLLNVNPGNKSALELREKISQVKLKSPTQ